MDKFGNFEKYDYVEHRQKPLQIFGYVVDYVYVHGVQYIAVSEDKRLNSGEWYYGNHFRKGYEKKVIN